MLTVILDLNKNFETQYKMERRNMKGLSTGPVAGALDVGTSFPYTNLPDSNNRETDPEKEQNPNTKWLRDAKWGVFTHFLPHMASRPIPIMNREQWNKKVNSFDVKKLGDQLSALKAPYFFITVGQQGKTFCSPNEACDRLFGVDNGVRTDRDLIADLAAELIPRGIKMCVYCPAYGTRLGPKEDREKWYEVITEWSERWGKSVSAWWADEGGKVSYEVYMRYHKAFKAGNKDSMLATKIGPMNGFSVGREDYSPGEVGWDFPVGDPNIDSNHQDVSQKKLLHYLTFMGIFWGMGEPRFPVEFVLGWQEVINKMGGVISWDIPVTDSGEIPGNMYRQLAAVSKQINSGS